MSTNFEAWRDQLTPEGLWHMWNDIYAGCWPCGYCKAHENCNCGNIFAHLDLFNEECFKTFTAWASAPAKEEATK